MNPAFQVQFHQLELKHAFKIAHGSSKSRQVLRLSSGPAVGEAPFVPYYKDQPEDVKLWLEQASLDAPSAAFEDAPKVAQLALDMLRQNQRAQKLGLPLYQALGLPNPHGQRKTFRSVGLEDEIDTILEKVLEHSKGFKKIKLKLGSGNLDFDEELCARTRELLPEHELCADVNGGWTPKETLKMLPKLTRWTYAFLEQPVHHEGGSSLWEEVDRGRPSRDLPLYADENLQSVSDLNALAPWIQGANIKLLKAGTLAKAIAMIEAARTARLQVLLGCMVEGSIGITCAAHLSGIVDEVDLDGALYLQDDDYLGTTFGPEGLVQMPKGPGLGGAFQNVLSHESHF